jgi:hypothetical protein
MSRPVILAYEFIKKVRCAKLEDVARYIAEKTGRKYSVNLLKDVHDVVSSLAKSGTVVRIARGYYCIREEEE